ncbi:chromate transporter [Paenibacillus sp. 1011MAR3C5]|uniref:chromate transporter n=1 Tax=Paenibacillus sp. 1011MAR3C5 TaxID=1675787 RepID=UPI000E6C1C07|nr:chromate transporter [Paenibacillus sp. 1011MAR3C5]RJE87801.1 chromate transporter [Paenibacillus sp. 1011MAR3C5]
MAVWLELLGVSTKLGLTSFGGPIAHLGYFHDEYVRRRKWLGEQEYAELVALCQFLPGPASSQVGIGIGLKRGGLLGGVLSFIGFTWPSVLALMLFGWYMQASGMDGSGWLHGLKLVAVAIVAHAIVGMGQKLASGRLLATIAAASASSALIWPTAYTQIAIIAVAGAAGIWLCRNHPDEAGAMKQGEAALGHRTTLSRRFGFVCLTLFACLLVVLPLLRDSGSMMAMADSFYRSGSLVFGGGHVVLPLLEDEIAGRGWVNAEQFLAGYGAAQAVPGPLFTFAAYLGAVMAGPLGAAMATIAIFLPAFLLVAGVLPFWDTLRGIPLARRALAGINAAVVGLLFAAFYDPIWTSAIGSPQDVAFAAILFVLLSYWKLPPWIIVVLGAAGGALGVGG